MNWSRTSCGRVLIWHHIEIKKLITIVFNDPLIDDCSLIWVWELISLLLEKPQSLILVYHYVQKLVLMKLVFNFGNFLLQTVLHKWRASNTISENDNLVWLMSIVFHSIIFISFINKFLKYFMSSLSYFKLLPLFGPAISDHFFP